MGDIQGAGQADERPVRDVKVEGFWMLSTKVTRAVFAVFIKDIGHDTGNTCWVYENGWKQKYGLH